MSTRPQSVQEVAARAGAFRNQHGPANGNRPAAKFVVTKDEKGRLVFPPIPAEDDHAANCGWLTVALALNTEMPINRVEWKGRRGRTGTSSSTGRRRAHDSH